MGQTRLPLPCSSILAGLPVTTLDLGATVAALDDADAAAATTGPDPQRTSGDPPGASVVPPGGEVQGRQKGRRDGQGGPMRRHGRWRWRWRPYGSNEHRSSQRGGVAAHRGRRRSVGCVWMDGEQVTHFFFSTSFCKKEKNWVSLSTRKRAYVERPRTGKRSAWHRPAKAWPATRSVEARHHLAAFLVGAAGACLAAACPGEEGGRGEMRRRGNKMGPYPLRPPGHG